MLTLTLTLDKEMDTPGLPILARVALRNAGADPLLVNARMALNASFAPAPFRDLSFILTGPDGAPCPFRLKINIGYPSVEDFRELGPGQVIERSYRLRDSYELASPGRCSVRAIYQNTRDPGDGREAWKGEVESVEAGFTLAA